MQNILRNNPDNSYSPWLLLVILAGYILAALFAFNMIALLVVLPFFDFDFMRVSEVLSNPEVYPESRIVLLIIQFISSLGAFILTPWFFTNRYLKIGMGDFFALPQQEIWRPILLTLVVTFTFMMVNSVVIEWNREIKLPESLSWFEEQAQAKEGELERLTKFLTEFDGLGHFILGILAIAVLPGIGEELLFRGLVQNILFKAFKNPHAAIWIAAFLFSAIHFQFYGLVPRMLLGALFGYLYFFSGKLIFPMLAHFLNNCFMLVMLYLHQIGTINYNIQDAEPNQSPWIALLFIPVTLLLLLMFYRHFKTDQNNGPLAESL
jgi:hypothetical protein